MRIIFNKHVPQKPGCPPWQAISKTFEADTTKHVIVLNVGKDKEATITVVQNGCVAFETDATDTTYFSANVDGLFKCLAQDIAKQARIRELKAELKLLEEG